MRELQKILDLFGTSGAGRNDLPYFSKNSPREIFFQANLSFFEQGFQIFRGNCSGMVAPDVGSFGQKRMRPGANGSQTFSRGAFFGGNVNDGAHFLFEDRPDLQDDPEMSLLRAVLHEKRVPGSDHGSLKTSSKKASSCASSAASAISFPVLPRASKIRSTGMSRFLDVSFHSGRS